MCTPARAWLLGSWACAARAAHARAQRSLWLAGRRAGVRPHAPRVRTGACLRCAFQRAGAERAPDSRGAAARGGGAGGKQRPADAFGRRQSAGGAFAVGARRRQLGAARVPLQRVGCWLSWAGNAPAACSAAHLAGGDKAAWRRTGPIEVGQWRAGELESERGGGGETVCAVCCLGGAAASGQDNGDRRCWEGVGCGE